MTKRELNSNDKRNNKKIKFDEDLDALWGDDDLDESVFENCLSQALCQTQKSQNSSILPSYDAFKKPQYMVTSTQEAVSSKFNEGTQTEIKRLKIQYEEKEGEIAILRSQLREMKVQMNAEHIKQQSELKEKLVLSQKQIQSIKSELEFKNLEIANLKQKVGCLSKLGLNVTISNEINRRLSKDHENNSNNKTNKLYPSEILEYPLKDLVMEPLSTLTKREKYIIDNKLTHVFKNSIPYLQNKNVSSRVILNKNRANSQKAHSLMLKLLANTSIELNSVENIPTIAEIICTCLQSLDDLLEMLNEIKDNLRTEDLSEADACFMKKTPTTVTSDENNEFGRHSAMYINFLAVVLPYSKFLQQYFFQNECLSTLKELEGSIPNFSVYKSYTGQDFLNKLICVLKIIGQTRKCNVTSIFLNSTIELFKNICQVDGYYYLSEIICKYIKEIICTRPVFNVILNLSYLLKEASRHTKFVQFLLSKTKNSTIKKGILYYNEGNCSFYIFLLLFDKLLSKSKIVPLEVCLNMLFFIYNTFKSSYFLHHENTKECECLPQLYKLVIEIIFRMLEKYGNGFLIKNEKKMFDLQIVFKTLNLMTHHSYELLEKYIFVYSQFKEIERKLKEWDVNNLESLYINEDIPEIDSKSFQNIGF